MGRKKGGREIGREMEGGKRDRGGWPILQRAERAV